MRFFLIICLLFSHYSFAKPLNGTSPDFNVKKANQLFDHINLELSVQNLNLNTLTTAIDTLTEQTTKADQCVDTMQKKLYSIELLIKQGMSAGETSKQGADLVYLNNQQKALADEQAQCRLFSIRAKEAIEAYKTAVGSLKQEEALARGTPLWIIINQIRHAQPENNMFNVLLAIPAILPLSSWLLMISSSLLASIAILLRIRQSRFANRYLHFKTLHLGHVVLLALFFIAGGIHLLLLTKNPAPVDPPLALSALVFFYLASLVGILLFFRLKKITSLFHWYSLNIHFFQLAMLALSTIYAIAMTRHILVSFFNPHSPLWQLCQSLFLLMIMLTIAYFINAFCKMHRHLPFIKKHQGLILRSSFTALIACAVINILGYHTLARYLVLSGLTTFSILFITLLMTKGLNKLYLALHQKPTTNAMIIKYFGYRSDQVFTEFLILKTTLQLIIIALSIYLIGQSFGFATVYIGNIYDKLLHGVHLLNNITLYPTRIIAGVIVFCILYLGCRSLSTAISRHQQFEDEEETQVAVASILTYIGFSLAFIIGLLIAGFDFTGLAIIAGALSVGIGLGLQSIVNNFVSGLILLIEKPIRPGDRINVDGIEGFVKKIRIRSTQIISPAREDIIVPNSDLITRRVTNYMFSDKYCRINCEVSVAYGSNTYLVRDVLLNIANNHEEIIKTTRNKPAVLFNSFSNSALVFQLSCLIKDVNKKSLVRSELNFAIEHAFREHQIDMAFQERELHVKLADLEPLLTHLNQCMDSFSKKS